MVAWWNTVNRLNVNTNLTPISYNVIHMYIFLEMFVRCCMVFYANFGGSSNYHIIAAIGPVGPVRRA